MAEARSGHHFSERFFNKTTTWLILFISLAITLCSGWISNDIAQKRAQDRFNAEVEAAQRAILSRMLEYEHVLHSSLGLFLSSENVTRAEWHDFIENLKINKHLPGIQGIGYAAMITEQQLPSFVEAVRKEGFPDFQVKPAGVRPLYSSIIYLEPFTGRNLRAFGYDMYSEPTRHQAMQLACDNNQTSISGKVKLVQETEQDVQAGFLMYLPKYQKGLPIDTIEQRRAALQGFVYAPFRATDLMQNILGSSQRLLDFNIYDGKISTQDDLLYASPNTHSNQPIFSKEVHLQLPNRQWTIQFESSATLEQEVSSKLPLLITLGGLAFDLLLFLFVRSFIFNRQNNLQTQNEMSQLIERLKLSANVFQHADEAILISDKDNCILDVNPMFEHMTGYSRAEIIGKKPSILKSDRQDSAFYQKMWSTLLATGQWSGEIWNRKKDGTEYIESLRLSVVRNEHGEISHFVGLFLDISEEKQYEQRLKETNTRLFESDMQLNRAQEIAHLGSWYIDIETNQISWSKETYRIFGIAIGTPITFEDFRNCIHPEDQSIVLDAWDAASKGIPYCIEHRILVHNEVKWVQERAEMRFNHQCKAISATGTVLDITERKQIEHQLQQFSLAVEQSACSIIVTDAHGTIEYVNKGFELITGYSKHEAIGQNPKILHSGKTPQATYTSLWQNLSHGQVWSGEFYNRRKDGSEFTESALITPIRNNDGKIIKYVAVKEDISEKNRLRAELDNYRLHLEQLVEERTAELAARERFIRSLVDIIPGMVGYWNTKLHCEFANAGYLEWFNKTPNAMKNIHIRDLFGETIFEASKHFIFAALAGERQVFERCLTKTDGTLGYLLVHYVPDILNGEVRGFFAVATDVTQVKMTERALLEAHNAEKAKQLAEAANRAKSNFIANMSHEIRTPMNAVIGLAQLLLDSELPTQQRAYVEKLQNASRSLLGILNDILDYSKIEAGRLELENIEFDLYDIIESTAGLFAISADERNLELIFDVDQNIPSSFIGDPLRIKQVLNNLLGNAIKFTQQGHIIVNISGEPQQDNLYTLTIAVSDTGIGMNEEQLNKLFHAFSQADTSTTRKFGGTGLGLTICKHLADLMHGQIQVVSKPDQGSTFTISIPLPVSPQSQKLMPLPSFCGMRTLIIDDKPIVSEVLHKLLYSWEFLVEKVNSGEQALAKIRHAWEEKQPYELILLNWRLSGMDSTELILRLRAEERIHAPKHHQTLVVMVSALSNQDVRHLAHDIEFDGILEKPILASSLHRLLLSLDKKPLDNHHTPRWSAIREERSRMSAILGAQILLVEDNPFNQLIAREILEKFGLSVTTANNGPEAIALASEHRYHAILMDIQMLGMNGIETTLRIRALPNYQQVPIIAMTAANTTSDRDACKNAGMNDFIAKPVEINKLSSVLLQWIKPPLANLVVASETVQIQKEEQAFSLPGLKLDEAVIRLGHDWGLLRQALQGFNRDFRNTALELEQLIQQQRWEDARRIAHTIKGVAKSIGANELFEISQQLGFELEIQQCQQLEAFKQKLEQIILATSNLPEPTYETACVCNKQQLSESINSIIRILHLSGFVPSETINELGQHINGLTQYSLFKKFKISVEAFDYSSARQALTELAKLCDVFIEE